MMKTQKLEYSEQQSLDTCIRQLEALLESLKAASVSLSRNGNKLWLRPGATVDVRLSAEQSGDREQLQICLGWRRRSLSVVARPDTDMPPETVRDWQEIEGQPDVAPANEQDTGNTGPLPVRGLDAAAVGRYQEIYASARGPSGDGHQRLDEARFLRALEQAGLEPLVCRQLHELALQADAEGRTSLFAPHVIAALRKAS
jgi:amphi-Trp domain-containing protein